MDAKRKVYIAEQQYFRKIGSTRQYDHCVREYMLGADYTAVPTRTVYIGDGLQTQLIAAVLNLGSERPVPTDMKIEDTLERRQHRDLLLEYINLREILGERVLEGYEAAWDQIGPRVERLRAE